MKENKVYEGKLNIKKLGISDNVDNTFDCGDYEINDSIINSNYANVYRQICVYAGKIMGNPIGYFIFSIGAVNHHDIEEGFVDNNYGVGVAYLKFIAVDINSQKNGYGSDMLRYFITMINKISKDIPIRFIILDSLPNKVNWYKKIGFKQINGYGERMYYDLFDLLNENEKSYLINYLRGGRV